MKLCLNKKFALLSSIILLPGMSYAINYQAPITVDDLYIATNGNMVKGNYQGTLTQPAITVTTQKPVIIANSNLAGPGDLIYAKNASLTVINTKGLGTNPNQVGVRKGMFLHVENVVNIIMINNFIESVGYPVYLHNYKGNYTPGQTVKIFNNQFYNVDARPSDGKDGYKTSGNGATHAILLNTLYNVPNIEIAWNQIVNVPYISDCSDIINIYDSSGTSKSHILIHDNYAQGAYSITPGSEAYTGGGIIVEGAANSTAATTSSFVDVYDNQVVSTSNYGISVAAGHDNNVFNNRVISSGHLSNGVFYAMHFGNGLNNYNNYNQPASVYFNNYVSKNTTGLIRPNPSTGIPERSDWYLPGQSSTGNNISFSPNNNSSPTLTDEANEWTSWKNKLTSWQTHEGLKYTQYNLEQK
jgi:hypothetical protein